LIDPDHITSFNIDALYNHLLSRQKNKLPPFIVLNPSPLHEPFMKKKSEKAKGKKKMEWEDVSTDDGDDGEEEETNLRRVEDARRGVKFGPPKKGPPSSQPDRYQNQVAGPSNLAPPKRKSNEKDARDRGRSKSAPKKSRKKGLVDGKVRFILDNFF
jgi:hypothetical protein